MSREPFAVAYTGSLTEVPPAGDVALYVRYQLDAFTAPYDADDAHVSAIATVTIDRSAGERRVLSLSIDQ